MSMSRAEVLDAARQAVMVDRAATHGDVERNFEMIAGLWSVYLGVQVTPADVGQMMILLKSARAKQNPGYADNWVDQAGFAACGGEIATRVRS